MAVRGHPKRPQQAMQDESGVQDVQEVFTGAGGSEEEWGILFQREDVPTQALQRIDEGEPLERPWRMETPPHHQAADDEGEPHAPALARVLEAKRSKSHVSLVIKFLAAKPKLMTIGRGRRRASTRGVTFTFIFVEGSELDG